MTVSLALLVLLLHHHLSPGHCGCRYSNPVWIEDDGTAPRVQVQDSSSSADNSTKFLAQWNTSLVGNKTKLCIDQVQLWTRVHGQSTDRLLCSVNKTLSAAVLGSQCSFHIDKSEHICGNGADFWLALLNRDHFSNAVQTIKSPGITRKSNFNCGHNDTEQLSEVVRSASCDSLAPKWKSKPKAKVEEAAVIVAWTSAEVDNVDCVDSFELKYWQSGAFVPKQHIRKVENAVGGGGRDKMEEVLRNVEPCKKYTLVVKAIQKEPYYATSSQQMFKAHCPGSKDNNNNDDDEKNSNKNKTTLIEFHPEEVAISNVVRISKNESLHVETDDDDADQMDYVLAERENSARALRERSGEDRAENSGAARKEMNARLAAVTAAATTSCLLLLWQDQLSR